ncbi:helicase-associated domain-containing protein [Paenibacillus athensensis]|uniref:Helicase XPB/Ssl2 N-terminal domain-containing protein n=1 Tax=Paenibacillus athensensis TaxID=1967502 RepID=A0A4Y8PTW0_9BACL|nr:helicase-associated domain-containing protein [Paenibacillus athensensis]MCD1257924.1 helicase-associated domain-containing protein [Paenibacillus athensensis]
MRYEQVLAKTPVAVRQLLEQQPWVEEARSRGLSLQEALTEAAELARLLSQLSQAERCTLALIVRRMGSEPFAPAALERQLDGATAGAAVRVGLAGLRARGVIVAFRKTWGERLYALPEDGFAVWQALLLPSLPLAGSWGEGRGQELGQGQEQEQERWWEQERGEGRRREQRGKQGLGLERGQGQEPGREPGLGLERGQGQGREPGPGLERGQGQERGWEPGAGLERGQGQERGWEPDPGLGRAQEQRGREHGPVPDVVPESELELLELPAGANPRGMAQQLFHLLAEFDRLDVPLTAKGAPHKKALARLAERHALPAEPLAGCGLSHAFSDACGLGLAVLLDAAMRLGLLGRAAGRLVLRPAALGAWLSRPYAEQMGRLYGLWRAVQAPQPVWQQHAIALLERAGGAGWQPAAALGGWLAAYAAEPGADEAELVRGVRERWLTPLHALGWLELAQDSAGALWYRWKIGQEPSSAVPKPLQPALSDLDSPLSSAFDFAATAADAADIPADAACRLYVQPDFELLLPPGVPLSVEWQIAAMAELQHSDELRVYRLTQEAFHRACERGGSAEAALALLARWNRAGQALPEAVERALREWGEQYGKVRFQEVTLLVCDSPEMATALAASERCRPYLDEAVGERHFIVSRTALPALHKQLRLMGWTPGAASPPPSAQAMDEEKSMEAELLDGWVYGRDAAALYEVDGQFDGPADLYPQLPDIPVSWLKESRSYHGSTRKELIRRAIEWQSWLKVRRAGEERLITPRALLESREGWLLVGGSCDGEVRLNGEEWSELQLVLPGINESMEPGRHPLLAPWS